MIFDTDDRNGGNLVRWTVKEETTLSDFFLAYGQRIGIKIETLCFQIERTSEIITPVEGEIPIGAFVQEGDRLILC